jgi:hypothetical protein
MIMIINLAIRAQVPDMRRRLGVALGVIVFVIVAAASTLASDAPAASNPPGDPVQLVGKWQRTDGGYVMELTNPTFDGRLTAAYFNPRPINVSRSGWVLEDGNLLVFVELRDQGYPGSTYTLAYQPDSDRLVGIYFQAAVQQRFEVVFKRIG